MRRLTSFLDLVKNIVEFSKIHLIYVESKKYFQFIFHIFFISRKHNTYGGKTARH